MAHQSTALHRFTRTGGGAVARRRVFVAAAVSLSATACTADAPAGSPEDLAGNTDTTPVAPPSAAPSTTNPAGESPAPALDMETALALAAMPLSCVDRPHALRPDRAGYLDDIAYSRRRGFDRDRAFYGCWDWHSAVNSTWAMVRLMKEVPELAVTPLIREKLRDHLSEAAMEGELEYLTENASFERPYGWAWLLLLHAELASWDDEDASAWAERLGPVTDLVTERLVNYVAELEGPVRTGVHPNTAFAIATSLQATAMAERPELEDALRDAAVRFFAGDRRCPTAYEPGRSDFVSPCLEEAALMARVMERDAYVQWLDDFLPPMESDEFAALRTPVPVGASDDAPPSEGGAVITNDSLRAALGARSHLIGLAFTRADAMLRIVAALPAADPRVPRLRALADEHVQAGFDTMFDADYAGSHWIGSFALKYLVQATRGSVP